MSTDHRRAVPNPSTPIDLVIRDARIPTPNGATAVDVLMKTGVPNNGYTAAGHNPNTDLPVYLPGNGALLAAVAMMAGGWDGAPAGAAPGFPHDGTWVVRVEGLTPLP